MFDFDDVPEDMGGPSKQVQDALDQAVKERPRPERWKMHKEALADPATLPATLGTEVEAEVEDYWLLEEKCEWEAEYFKGMSKPAPVLPKLGVGITSPRPAPKTGKVPYCVLFICGMPQEQFGNSRSMDALPTRILGKCWDIGLPTVRFDYPGCGRSSGKMPSPDDNIPMNVCACRALRKVLTDIAEQVVILAFSAGNSCVMQELKQVSKEGRLAAYVCLSFGTRAMALAGADPVKALEKLKDPTPCPPDPELVSIYEKFDVPSLFIVGDQDSLTPRQDMEAVLQRMSRKPGVYPMGELQVLKGKHAFETGDDGEGPAVAIKEFLLRALTLDAA